MLRQKRGGEWCVSGEDDAHNYEGGIQSLVDEEGGECAVAGDGVEELNKGDEDEQIEDVAFDVGGLLSF